MISAGIPELFCFPREDYDEDEIVEKVLTYHVYDWSDVVDKGYLSRNYSMYVNENMSGVDAECFDLGYLDDFYAKYIDDGFVLNDSVFKKIYSDPYIKYQNLIDINEYYTIAYESQGGIYSVGQYGPSSGLSWGRNL